MTQDVSLFHTLSKNKLTFSLNIAPFCRSKLLSWIWFADQFLSFSSSQVVGVIKRNWRPYCGVLSKSAKSQVKIKSLSFFNVIFQITFLMLMRKISYITPH